MELSWQMKLRIAAVLATGFVLIGILAWPLAAPADPFMPVSLVAGSINYSNATILVVLAFVTGVIAFFISWPYGKQIGVLAVPMGLAIWSIRSGTMTALLQQNPTLSQRQTIFSSLKWEPLLWLIVVATGFAGVLLCQKSLPGAKGADNKKQSSSSNLYVVLNAAFALFASVIIAQILTTILAQDVRTYDTQLGIALVAQPRIGQIAFAVLVSFGLAAFILKKFFNTHYIWPVIAAALVPGTAITLHLKANVLQHLVQSQPATLFSSPVFSILPVQMVAFGTMGSIIGYWLAVKHSLRKQQQKKSN